MKRTELLLGVLGVTVALGGIAWFAPSSPVGSIVAAVGSGYDQYGYNDRARIFSGTAGSWCTARGDSPACMGAAYQNDKLLMKWNAEWDRGNAENWSQPPYDAWLNNEWNGRKGGSNTVWHYKIKWVGDCGEGAFLPDGSYCVWGQFAMLMDQGMDPDSEPAHTWFAHAKPNGYGAQK